MVKVLLLILFPLLLFARETSLSVKSFDLTKDGVLDRFETYEEGNLIKLEEDRNGDGEIDFLRSFKSEGHLEVELQDVNFNGKFERRRSIKSIASGKLEITTELDRNEDGVYEVKYVETVGATQEQTSCFEGVVFNKIRALAEDSMLAGGALNQGFIPTGFGYQIDGACLRNWGADFALHVRDSMKTGLQCLADLHLKYGSQRIMTGSLRNAFELTRLLESDQVKILCSEEEYHWDGTAGHASTVPGQSLNELGVAHPYISLNPHDPQSGQHSGTSEELAELKKTLFHEQLHNLGYRHGHDVEYPYACEDCCFADGEDEEVKEAACRVCAGNYQNEVDPKYVRDFIFYTQKSYRNFRGVEAALHFLKENPNSTQGLSLMALASADIFNPIGPHLAQKILDRNLSLSAQELSDTLRALEYKDISHFKTLKKSSEGLSEAMLALYYERDAPKALEVLHAHKEAIAKELYDAQESSSSVTYSARETAKILDEIISDIWLNYFPAGTRSTDSEKAYELFNYFSEQGLLD